MARNDKMTKSHKIEWKLMIWFCYFWKKKKCFLFWAWPMGTPFLHKLGQTIVIFRGFSNFFFRTIVFLLKLLILIESPNIFHNKPAKKIKVDVASGQNLGKIRSNIMKKLKKWALSIGFFIFYMGNTF